MFKYFNSFSCLLFPFYFFLFTCTCLAQSPYENGGTNSNLFLKMDVTPRAAALGGTFTAIANDENTLLYNTAGLAKPRSSFIALNHTQWFDDIRIENMLFTYKMSSGLGMGLGISYMGMPSIQGMSNSNSPTQEFDVSSSIVQLGFGYEIYYGAMLGLGVKYFNENLAGFTAGGVALDAGILFETMVRGLTVGFAVQNISGKIKYDFFNEKPPIVFRGGVAYKVPLQDLRFALDVVKSSDQDFQYDLGIEYILAKYAVLRLGNQAVSQKLFSPSFGVGANIEDKYQLDYTFLNHENLGATHRIGISFRFDIRPLFKGKKPGYNRRGSSIIKTPIGLRYVLKDNALVIKWLPITGAKYYVYAKTEKNGKWRKLNIKPIEKNEMIYKRPKKGTKYYITVTAVLNNLESAFARQIEVEVK
jgi:hypothetical protein